MSGPSIPADTEVRHFVACGELTHAGRVKAGKLAAASEEWLREQRGEPAEGWGR